MSVLMLATLPAGAADVLWSGAVTGPLDWNTGGNWTGGVVVNSSADRADLRLDWTDTPVLDLSAPVTINGVLFDDTGAAGDSTLTLGNGGVPANTLTLAGTAPSFAISGSTLIVSAGLSGAGDLNKSGAGTLVLSGANTYTGETNLGAGVINVATLSDYGVAGSLGNRASDSITSVGLHFTGGTLQYTGSAAQSTNRQIRMLNGVKTFIDASGAGSGTVSFTYSGANVNPWDTPGARTLTLTGSNTGANTFALNIQSHSSGQTSLVKSGAGKWDITNSHNSDPVSGVNNTFGGYGGGTILSGGTLGFASNAIGGGVIDFTGNATLSWDAGNTQDISSGTGGGVTRSLKIEDGVTATFDTGANDVTLGTAIAVGALKTGALTKTGAGTLTLSGANTYTGLTTVGEGTLKNGSATTFNSNGALTLTGTGVFDLNGFNAGFTNVSGAVNTSTITDSAAGAGTSTLAIGAQASTVSALILDGASRKVAVTMKNSNGAVDPFLLTGANTFSGGLTLLHTASGSRLRITGLVTTVGAPGAIISSPFGTGAITIGQAATDKAGILLDTVPNNTIVNDIVFNTILGTDLPGIRLDTTGHTFSGTITANLSDALFANTGSASLTGKVTGAGGLQLAGASAALSINLGGSTANDYAGTTQVKAGMLILAKPAGVNAIPGNITIGDGVGNDIIRVTVNEQIADSANISFTSGLSANSAILQLAGGVTETVGGISTAVAGKAPVIETSSAGTGTLIVNTAADSTYDGILRNANGGTLAFTKQGAGNLTFQNTGGVAATNYSGATLIGGGTLTLSSVAGSGNSGFKAVINSFASPITNNAALVLSNVDSSETMSKVISGSGSLTKSGAGTVTLNQANTYSGGTTVNGGTLNIATIEATAGGASGLGTATSGNVVTVNNGAVLNGTRNNWLDSTGSASGGANAHTLVVNAGGMVTNGPGVITGLGNTTLNGGTLELNTGYGGPGWNGAYTLMGDITVGGSSPSAITTKAGAGAASNLQMSNGANGTGGTRTLTVADVTGNAASDLVVSAQIISGTLVKAGPGTVELALGSVGSAVAVNWRLNGGTLKTTSNNVVGGSANITGTSTGTTFDLGGTTQAVGSLGAAGAGNGYRGGIVNGTIDLNGHNAYLQNGTFTMDLTGGGGSRLWIGGDAGATVNLGGLNTSTFTDNNSTIIGHPTTGSAGSVVLQSATALGPASQNAQVFTGTLDLNGQTNVGIGGLLLAGASASKLVNGNTSAGASFAGGINLNSNGSPLIGGAGDLTLGGVVVNGGFTKTGAGTLTLGGGNTYAGQTDVQEGALLVNGIHTGGGLIAVSSTATFGGGGQVGPVDFFTGGTLSPGDAGRTDNWLEAGALSLGDATTSLRFELGAPDDGGSPLAANDLMIVTSLPYLRGVLDVIPLAGFAGAPAGSKWRLIGITAGSVPAAPELTLGASVASGFTIQAAEGDSAVYLVSAVPEAATSGLLLLGLIILRNRLAARSRR